MDPRISRASCMCASAESKAPWRASTFARAARRAWRHVGGHRHRGARGERSERLAHRGRAAAVALALAGTGAPDQLHAEALEHSADKRHSSRSAASKMTGLPGSRFLRRIAVARDHGVDLGRAHGLELRQQQELTVPHGEDLRMLVEQLGVGVRGIAPDAARGVDKADIARGKRAHSRHDGLGC